jgi:hypothetical protein
VNLSINIFQNCIKQQVTTQLVNVAFKNKLAKYMVEPLYLDIMRNRLETLLGIAPNEQILNCLYHEITSSNSFRNIDDFLKLKDDELLGNYLAIQDFLSI